MSIQLHPGDMPGATGHFQENGNIHLAITVTARVQAIRRKTFPPSAFIFHLIHFPLLFHLENCRANLGWNCMGREGFLLTSRSCHLYIPLCTCQAQGLKWPAEGGFWEQPRQPVRIPKATAFPEPQTLACDSLVSYPQVSHWWANSIYYSSLLCT